MKVHYKPLSLILFIFLGFAASPGFSGQDAVDPEYWEVVMERGGRIVDGLDLEDAAKAARVQRIIAAFYADLSRIQDNADASDPAVQMKIEKVRRAFIGQLSAELTPAQVVGVKDGLTYGVVAITLAGYRKMLPEMTPEESRQLEAWLVEAREYAMVAGSSHEKHGWFGKYKGKITNYLSQRGYDLKKAEQRLFEDD
jgi:F0F1-type ATP synthase assembly protein I